MPLSIIAAVSENGVIGRDGDLPWHLSADLKRFKQLTMGHTIVMGRKTWDSIGRPLPGRKSVVVTRNVDFTTTFPEVTVTTDLETALSNLSATAETFIIGGASLYTLALPLADQLQLTRVHAKVDGDVYFPEINWDEWNLLEETTHDADDRNDHAYSFLVYQRVG